MFSVKAVFSEGWTDRKGSLKVKQTPTTKHPLLNTLFFCACEGALSVSTRSAVCIPCIERGGRGCQPGFSHCGRHNLVFSNYLTFTQFIYVFITKPKEVLGGDFCFVLFLNPGSV